MSLYGHVFRQLKTAIISLKYEGKFGYSLQGYKIAQVGYRVVPKRENPSSSPNISSPIFFFVKLRLENSKKYIKQFIYMYIEILIHEM